MVKADKFWTWLIVGLIGVLVVLPTLAGLAVGFVESLDVDWNKVLLLGSVGLIAVAVLWFFISVSGSGSSGHGSGQRALAQAQRDMSRAVEAVRSAHAQRMYTERAAQPARVAKVHAVVEERRALEHGKWLTQDEAKEELTHA